MNNSDVTIKKVLDKADIVDIISRHITLEKKGSDFKGLCPFHNDTNPSLSVSPSKQIYKCFSCGAAGNAITFVQRFENISFMQALRKVAEIAGIEVQVQAQTQEELQKERYYKVLEDAMKFYHFYLQNSKDGQTALAYLKNRYITKEIIDRFKIGLSSGDYDLLYQSMKQNHSELDLLEAGLIKKQQTYYDVFRHRIMFPLQDLEGHTVGFSGRIYDSAKKDEPKYVNSSENLVFKKGSILYNYFDAFQEIKQKDLVFVFEGFLDVIAAYRASVHNTVATMGTALTIDQVSALKKLTNHVVICFDGDQPGIEATKKAIQLFTRAQFDVKVLLFPEGQDPDDYINQKGSTALGSYLHNAPTNAFEFLYQLEYKKLVVEDMGSVENFKQNIFKVLSFYKSNVLNQRAFQWMADVLQVDKTALESDYKKVASSLTPISDIPMMEKPPVRIEREKGKYLSAQKHLVAIAYRNRTLSEYIQTNLGPHMVDIDHHSILLSIFQYDGQHDERKLEELDQSMDQHQLEMVHEILSSELYSTKVAEAQIDVLTGIVKKYKLELHKKQLEFKYLNETDPDIKQSIRKDIIEISRKLRIVNRINTQ